MNFDEKDEEIDDRRRQIAKFRREVIEELDDEGLPRGELSARIEELAAQYWQPPFQHGRRRYTARTLWSWWSAYNEGGLQALVPESRKGVAEKLLPSFSQRQSPCAKRFHRVPRRRSLMCSNSKGRLRQASSNARR